MTLLRRILAAAAAVAAVVGVIRLRGSGGVPPQNGGWRELDLDDPPA